MSILDSEIEQDFTIYQRNGFFFYWKCDSGRWESIVEQQYFQKYLIIPIAWSEHFYKERYDWGQVNSKLDFKTLIKIGKKHNKNVILAFSISPSPFLKGGGIPDAFSETRGQLELGNHQIFKCADHSLVKTLSFYDNRVFGQFSKFVGVVTEILGDLDAPFSVCSIEHLFWEQESFKSTFFEHSPSQKEALKNFKSLQQVTEEEGQNRFKKMLCSLYRKEVAKNFSSRYIGELKLGVIGASQVDTLDRIFNVVSFHDYSILLNFCISNKIYPSVSLLSPHEISPVLGRQMADLVTTQFLEDCLDDGIVSEGLDNFSCLNFMVMYKGSASEFIPPWEKTGLFKNLNRFFNQNYSKTARELPSVTDYDDESSDRVMMAPLCTFTLRDVQKVVYFFHQGEKLLLDTFQAPPEILSEIDTLSLNPEVKKQKISLDVDLTIYQKNNGVLLLWSSDEVRQKSEVLREDIWQSIFEALNLKNMSIQDEDVISFWRSRYPRSGELEYDEIRRVHFYNPTGIEKEIVAIVPQDFYLIKTLDCVKGSLEKLASKLIIKIRPQGSVSCDFGVIHESR